METVGPEYDLGDVEGRCRFILLLARISTLLDKMHYRLVWKDTSRWLYQTYQRGHAMCVLRFSKLFPECLLKLYFAGSLGLIELFLSKNHRAAKHVPLAYAKSTLSVVETDV